MTNRRDDDVFDRGFEALSRSLGAERDASCRAPLADRERWTCRLRLSRESARWTLPIATPTVVQSGAPFWRSFSRLAMTAISKPVSLDDTESFVPRHIGPNARDTRAMLDALGYESLEQFITAAVPERIRFRRTLAIGESRSEYDVLT